MPVGLGEGPTEGTVLGNASANKNKHCIYAQISPTTTTTTTTTATTTTTTTTTSTLVIQCLRTPTWFYCVFQCNIITAMILFLRKQCR